MVVINLYPFPRFQRSLDHLQNHYVSFKNRNPMYKDQLFLSDLLATINVYVYFKIATTNIDFGEKMRENESIVATFTVTFMKQIF